MTTPKSNPSKHYKHFRKAIAFRFRNLELCRHCRFRAEVIFRTFVPDSGFGTCICHVDRHGHFTLKQLRLPVLNETHTNSYTDPSLLHGNGFSGLYSQDQVHCPMQWHTFQFTRTHFPFTRTQSVSKNTLL